MTKVVILAGGLGTRISEETSIRPKPMIEVGGMPILWHIMKMYGAHGLRDFIICLGYKGYTIKEYFHNYLMHMSDVAFDYETGSVEYRNAKAEPWRVSLVDTGAETMTGGRIKRIIPLVAQDPYFCMTYGDGVGNIDIQGGIAAHRASGLAATVTAAQPPGRFGSLDIEGQHVTGFREKPAGDGGWVSCGFFVLSPSVGDLIQGDDTVWEQGPMEQLAASNQLGVVKHPGFWQPMDTLRDKNHLESLWAGDAPWRMW